MRLRLCTCLAALSFAVSARAYFLQEWTKTLPTNTTVAEVTVDSAGNTLLVGTDSTGDNALYVTKISPAGTNLWTQTISIAGSTNTEGRSVVVDSAGSVFIEYIAGNNLNVRKLRGTDGVTLGTFVVPDIIDAWAGRSDLVIDGANNVYLAARYFVQGTQLGGILVANINSASPANSTIRRHTTPYQTEIVKCRPRPQGGVVVLAGINVDTKITDGTFLSTLYSFAAAGSPTVTPVGYATDFASIPGTTDTLIAGSFAQSIGYIHLQELSATGEIFNSRNGIVGSRTAAFNDLFISKFGIVVTGGRVLETGDTDSDSVVSAFDLNNDLQLVNNYPIATVGNDQEIYAVKGDAYGTIACAEFFTSTMFKLIEIDPTSSSPISTRSYTSSVIASRPTMAMNAAGFTSIGMGNRVVGLKPRDLKDIYMGNTSYVGGTTATAIIRMYAPITSQRTVTLSDGGSPYVTIATSKVILAGQTQVSATVLTSSVPSTQNITLTAKYGNQTRTFALTLTP